jgi:hypothetical protein
VIVPLFAPHVELPGVTEIPVGPLLLEIFAEVEKTQPFASFTLMLCDPPPRFMKLMVDVYAEPSTEYVYGAVPPVTAPSVIVPLLAPQVALTVFTITAVGDDGCVLIVTDSAGEIQPVEFLTVTWYVPGATPAKMPVVLE